MLVSVNSPPLSERLVCGWRRVDRDQLASLLLASPLCSATPPATPNTDVDELFDTYNRVLLDLANQLAPRTSSVVALVVPRRGLTQTAENIVVNVIVLNVVTDAHIALTTAVGGRSDESPISFIPQQEGGVLVESFATV